VTTVPGGSRRRYQGDTPCPPERTGCTATGIRTRRPSVVLVSTTAPPVYRPAGAPAAVSDSVTVWLAPGLMSKTSGPTVPATPGGASSDTVHRW
jgi:hypothetical protein